MIHHTADPTGPEFELSGKPGPKWYQAYRERRANTAIKKAIRAYEQGKRNVIARESAACKAYDRAHRARGYKMLGYHWLVFPSGHAWEGRPHGYQGAHTVGMNNHLGISVVGNFEYEFPTNQALNTVDRLIEEHDIAVVTGHYQHNPTACPGKNLKRALGMK